MLDVIEENSLYIHWFEKVLSTWEATKIVPYTWDIIINVLKTPAVGEVALADEIQDKYIGNSGITLQWYSPRHLEAGGGVEKEVTCDIYP